MLSFNIKDFVNGKKIIGISTALNPKEFVEAIRPFFPSEDIESYLDPNGGYASLFKQQTIVLDQSSGD